MYEFFFIMLQKNIQVCLKNVKNSKVCFTHTKKAYFSLFFEILLHELFDFFEEKELIFLSK